MSENSVSSIHANHRVRMKNRFLVTEGKGFADHELLEMLLYYAVPRIDTNPLAHKLVTSFGGLDKVLSASSDEIIKINGAGESAAVLIKLVDKIASVCDDYDRKCKTMTDYNETGRYIVSEFKNANMEKVFMVLLDAKNNVLHMEFIAQGDFTTALTDFRKIATLVMMKNAAKVIIAHNHLDGDPNPSADDLGVTAGLNTFLKHMCVQLKEHFIIADNVYVGINHANGKDF